MPGILPVRHHGVKDSILGQQIGQGLLFTKVPDTSVWCDLSGSTDTKTRVVTTWGATDLILVVLEQIRTEWGEQCPTLVADVPDTVLGRWDSQRTSDQVVTWWNHVVRREEEVMDHLAHLVHGLIRHSVLALPPGEPETDIDDAYPVIRCY
jgi:hypothetical protein